MTDERVYELAAKAVQKNQLAEFLSGKNDYACAVDRNVPANIPTDFDRILRKGVYALYQNSRQGHVVEKYKDAILSLASMSPIDLWIAFTIVWTQLYNEKRDVKNPSPFNIIDQTIVDFLSNKLRESKEELSTIKEWQGWNHPEGLWGDIEIQNRKSIRWFGVSFI